MERDYKLLAAGFMLAVGLILAFDPVRNVSTDVLKGLVLAGMSPEQFAQVVAATAIVSPLTCCPGLALISGSALMISRLRRG